MFYTDLELRKEKIRNFIKENPKTTYRELNQKLHTKIERVYVGGMSNAFRDAGIQPLRTIYKKTKEERKKIIIDYIRKNPSAGGHTIAQNTKVNISSAFTNIKDAFNSAGIRYPRDKSKSKEAKRKIIIQTLIQNPLITLDELAKITKVMPYNYFKNFKEIYAQAGIKEINTWDKRTIKKRLEIINFIKRNPLATQREINKTCKTHVQELFKYGIFEAYDKAEIKFPYERLKLYGVALREIKQRAKTFENEVAIKLTKYGKVNRLIPTKRGIVDIVFERKNKKILIEVKDYRAKDISISQVKQLNNYLEDCNCNLGILVCYKKPKKDKFLIGKNKILVLESSELNKIPELTDGVVVSMAK